MELNERIKFLRKEELKFTQEDFANKINISRANLGSIEVGRINVTDRVIQDICRAFNVSREWIEFGRGEMFVNVPLEDEYFRAATEISKNNDKLAMQAIIEYWKLDEDSKKLLKDFIVHIAEKSKE